MTATKRVISWLYWRCSSGNDLWRNVD